MYGGRARRIELAKKGAIVLFCILVIYVSIKHATRKEVHYDLNSRFNMLSSYFQNRGYSCTDLVASGGKCTKNNENGVIEFTRYNNGFTFIDNNDTYVVSIYYQKDYAKNGIYLRTSNNALPGYKKRNYICSTKENNILNELDKCLEEDSDIELDSSYYIGAVENALKIVKEALNSSGYDVNVIISDYKWVRVV